MIRPTLTILLATAWLASSAAAEGDRTQAKTASGFMLADVNGDGRVTVEELDTFLNARFSVLDSDSDGRVAVSEWQQRTSARRGPPPEGRFRGPPPGGFAGRPPGPPPGAPPGPPPGPPPGDAGFAGGPPDMANDFPFPQPEDSDEDGYISRAEFVAPAAAMIDYWDINHDGAVTADEAAAPHPNPDR